MITPERLHNIIKESLEKHEELIDFNIKTDYGLAQIPSSDTRNYSHTGIITFELEFIIEDKKQKVEFQKKMLVGEENP